MPRITGPIVRRDTSLGVHVRALAATMANMLYEQLHGATRPGGTVALRDHLAALLRAYPEYLELNEVELLQALAEEDGDAVSEGP